jgi:hypothetical protein
VSTQRTLFPDPEPERHGPISEPLDPNVIYGTLEDDYDESFWKLSDPPDITLNDIPPPEPARENLPFGIAAYVQELYENWRPQIGQTLAIRRVQRIFNDYHQIEVVQ